MILEAFLTLNLLIPINATENWNCRNNEAEINCANGKCEVNKDFTPMDVNFNELGKMSVCAYSGCWEGSGKVTKSGNFLSIIGNKLKFSTNPTQTENVAIIFDKEDKIAIIKAGGFAHPMACEKK